MVRKYKKKDIANGGVKTAQSRFTQLEWGTSVIDGASRWLGLLYRIYCAYKILQPWIEKHIHMLIG
jgi:hypothetical protein